MIHSWSTLSMRPLGKGFGHIYCCGNGILMGSSVHMADRSGISYTVLLLKPTKANEVKMQTPTVLIR